MDRWLGVSTPGSGDERDPRDDVAAVGGRSVRYGYRLSVAPDDIDTINCVHHDVFQADDGSVLVVATALGTEGALGDDVDETTGTRVWEAPSQTAEPPRHLAIEQGRRAVEDWLFDGISPTEVRWNRTVSGRYDDRLDVEEAVDSDELPHAVQNAFDEAFQDFRWSLGSRDVEIDDIRLLRAAFPDGASYPPPMASPSMPGPWEWSFWCWSQSGPSMAFSRSPLRSPGPTNSTPPSTSTVKNKAVCRS